MAQKLVRRTQAQRSEEMRQRLLDAAFTVLQRRGYVGFRIAEVAKIAGVSRGAQLHHFPTKESLVVATIEHVFARVLEQARQRAEAAASQSRDPLAAIIDDSSDFFFGDNFAIALDVVMAAAKDDRIRERIFAISRDHRLPAESAWLRVLTEAGLPEDFAEDALWLTISIVRGLAVRRLWQKDPERGRRLLRLWRQIFWTYVEADGLLPEPAAARLRDGAEPPPRRTPRNGRTRASARKARQLDT
ncbi:MAG TPA: TetR/AcrR family transcriptional regulator [Stellaceae bacterium]|nr:TetR/AcrR family transcriptional regulator [Stellaceae bacterium]